MLLRDLLLLSADLPSVNILALEFPLGPSGKNNAGEEEDEVLSATSASMLGLLLGEAFVLNWSTKGGVFGFVSLALALTESEFPSALWP